MGSACMLLSRIPIRMKAVLVNYNTTPDWLLTSDLDYLLYDRSDSKEYLKDFPQERIIYTENIGQVDYDKLSYLVDNYYNLPDVFLWGKANLFKSVTEEDLKLALERGEYTPLIRQDHRTYSDDRGVVSYYQDAMYWERNDSWYFWSLPAKYSDYGSFARDFQLPNPPYIPFNPGGNFILTKDKVHQYSRDFYEKMRDSLPHVANPAEAHCCERSYYTLWR